jgi:hypothetical protein
MPMPGGPGISLFQGTDVTDFLEEWNVYADMAGLTDILRLKLFPKYCAPLIAQEIKMSYEGVSWGDLQRGLKDDYKKTDYRKIRGGLTYLEQLANAKRSSDSDEIRRFMRGFVNHAHKAIATGITTDYNMSLLLFKGCGERVMKKTIRKLGIKEESDLVHKKLGDVVKEVSRVLDGDEVPEFLVGDRAKATALADDKHIAAMAKAQKDAERQTLAIDHQEATDASKSTPMGWQQQQEKAQKGDPISELTRQMEQLAIYMAHLTAPGIPASANASRSQRSGGSGEASAPCALKCDQDHREGWRYCPVLLDLLRNGLLHYTERGLLAGGPYGSGNPPIDMRGGVSREKIIAEAMNFATGGVLEGLKKRYGGPVTVSEARHVTVHTAAGTQMGVSAAGASRSTPHGRWSDEMLLDGDSLPVKRPEKKDEPAQRRLQQELADMKDKANARLLRLIMEAQVSTDVKTLVAGNEPLRKAVFGRLPLEAARDIAAVHQAQRAEEVDDCEATVTEGVHQSWSYEGRILRNGAGEILKVSDFIEPCGYAYPSIYGKKTRCLLDGGSEGCLIDKALALSLPAAIGPNIGIYIKGIGGHQSVAGTLIDAPVTFGSSTSAVNFIVMESLEAGVILGRKWMAQAKFSSYEGEDGRMHCAVEDDETGGASKFIATHALGQDMGRLRGPRRRDERAEAGEALN